MSDFRELVGDELANGATVEEAYERAAARVDKETLAAHFRLHGLMEAKEMDRSLRSKPGVFKYQVSRSGSDGVEDREIRVVHHEPEVIDLHKALASHDARRHGAEVIDLHSFIVRCDTCRQLWSPNLGDRGRLAARWWACPNGCEPDE